MLENSKQVPDVRVPKLSQLKHQTTRVLILDGCQLPAEAYDKIKAGFLADLGKPGADSVSFFISTLAPAETQYVPLWHSWAWKNQTSGNE